MIFRSVGAAARFDEASPCVCAVVEPLGSVVAAFFFLQIGALKRSGSEALFVADVEVVGSVGSADIGASSAAFAVGIAKSVAASPKAPAVP